MAWVRGHREYIALGALVLSAILWWYIAERLGVEVRVRVEWMSDPIEMVEHRGPITLTWDAPVDLSHYRIYYRRRGDDEWVYHGSAEPTANPRYTADLPDGDWEVAIRWVGVDGTESLLHRSTDATAAITEDVRGGWYVRVQ